MKRHWFNRLAVLLAAALLAGNATADDPLAPESNDTLNSIPPEFRPQAPSQPEATTTPEAPTATAAQTTPATDSTTAPGTPTTQTPTATTVTPPPATVPTDTTPVSTITPGDTALDTPGDTQIVTPAADVDVEIVRERYQNTKVKIERGVTQDTQGNFINHGDWKWWTETGIPIATGRYHLGTRDGTWVRRLEVADAAVLQQAPFNEFTPPFVSIATFSAGQLNGTWTIYDANERKASEVPFKDDKRHGQAKLFYVSGQLMRAIDFQDGVIHGSVKNFQTDGSVINDDTYETGRRLAPRIRTHQDSTKKAEVTYLHALVSIKERDDWWKTQFAVYGMEGKETKHGPWRVWWENGQPRVEGTYNNDVPTGKYTWWYANGQKQMEGEYDANGKQQGDWVWWHENGIKAILGKYRNGKPFGEWIWWKDSGKVAQRADMSSPQAAAVANRLQDAVIPEPELFLAPR